MLFVCHFTSPDNTTAQKVNNVTCEFSSAIHAYNMLQFNSKCDTSLYHFALSRADLM
jgi:hypothetical protein